MMHALSRDPRALKKEIEYSKKRKVLPYNTGGGFFLERSTRRDIIFRKQRKDFLGLEKEKGERIYF